MKDKKSQPRKREGQYNLGKFSVEDLTLEVKAYYTWKAHDENIKKTKSDFRHEIIIDAYKRLLDGSYYS